MEKSINLPERPHRHAVIHVLREELGASLDTEHLIEWIEDQWETTDLLVTYFGEENALKIIHARSEVPVRL